MAINKIKSNSIADDAITSDKVADGVISAADVADGTLTNAKLADGTLTNAKLSDGTLTNAKINASAAIDYSKLNLTGNIALADLSATGTKDATTFLRGDNSFAVVDTNTVIDLTNDLSSNGFGKMKLKYTEVSVSGTGFVYLGFCRESTNCGGALGEVGIPLGFIPGVEYNASFTVGDLAVEPWPASTHRFEYKVNISSYTTGGTLGIIYLGAST